MEQQKRKFDTKKDHIWERINVERQLLKDDQWKILSALDEEYRKALNTVSFDLYYLEYFYKSRYIEKACTIYFDLETETAEESMLEVISTIEEKIDKENTKYGKSQMPTYEIFKRDQNRKLNNMLSVLINKNNALEILKEGQETLKFGVLEFRFFSFLVDTYDNTNAKCLRKKKYSYITQDYYFILKNGIIMLSELHPNVGDAELLVSSWKYDATIAQKHLEDEVEKFKKTLDKAVKAAYMSDYSELHLDYIADMVTKITQSIEDIFKI